VPSSFTFFAQARGEKRPQVSAKRPPRPALRDSLSGSSGPVPDLPDQSVESSPAAEFAFLAVRLYSGLHRLPVTPEQVARERLGAAIHRRVGDDLRLGRLVETLEAPSDYPPDPGITSVTAPSRVNIVLRFTQTTTIATRTKNQVS
jgi:hypothetical protein